jgi:hypothetical protein
MANGTNNLSCITVEFLLDSGASNCLIDEDIVNQLGLVVRSPNLVLSAGTAVPAKGGEVDLSLRLFRVDPFIGWVHDTVSVTAVSPDRFRRRGFRGLIGRDILDQGCITFNGSREVILAW